jgi:hypothetical protein
MTEAVFTLASPSVDYHYAAGTKRVTFYTLTSSSSATATDPTGWTLSGSHDGTAWTVVDQRTDQTFRWRSQTRAFQVAAPDDFAFYRLSLTGAAGISLAEIELLATP